MKKILSVVLAVIMVLSCFGIMTSAAGDSISAATNVTFNTTYNGTFSVASKKDFYDFSLLYISNIPEIRYLWHLLNYRIYCSGMYFNVGRIVR